MKKWISILVLALPALASAWMDSSDDSRSAGGRDQSLALLLEFGATIVPALGAIPLGAAGSGAEKPALILFTSGIVLGPSAGQIYAGAYKGAILGAVLRGAGVAMLVAGVSESLSGRDCPDEDCPRGDGSLLATGGLLALATGTIYSLVDGPMAAGSNRSEQRAGLNPILGFPNGEMRAGAVAWMRF